MSRSEPVFNVPAAVTWTALVIAAVHLARSFLSARLNAEIELQFGFLPVRYHPDAPPFPAWFGVPPEAGGAIAFVSHALLHADWAHLLINLGWIVAIGAAVAQRAGGFAFLAVFLIGVVAGAAGHLVTNWGDIVPMVGASGGASALLGALIRFVTFSNLGAAVRGPRRPVTHRWGLMVTAVIVVTNLAVGFLFFDPLNPGAQIAWAAHIAGYLAGYLSFGVFDRRVRIPGAA